MPAYFCEYLHKHGHCIDDVCACAKRLLCLVVRIPFYGPRCTGWAKKMAQNFYTPITLSNINRFLNFFHCRNQKRICNNNITKDLTTPQMCRHTT